MNTNANRAELAQTIARLEGKRDCACVSEDATECTSFRYRQDREQVRANDDQCQCGCHCNDEYEDDYANR
jgi:hypothetical protein